MASLATNGILCTFHVLDYKYFSPIILQFHVLDYDYFSPIILQFIIDSNNGIISVGNRAGATDWVYHFRAVASDRDGSSADVPVSVNIFGE